MFLLIPETGAITATNILNLHSTMFLLIQENAQINGCYQRQFTFHNVSINSNSYEEAENLLLQFTFHNVSINSPVT